MDTHIINSGMSKMISGMIARGVPSRNIIEDAYLFPL